MKTGQTFRICMLCAVMAVGAAIYAQESRSAGERQRATTQERQLTERQLKEKHFVEVTMGGDRGFAFIEPLEHRMAEGPIKGAPFSAQVVIEDTQTLANGAHINRKSAGLLYRDSDGRTRTEEPREGGPEMVFINDPVAKVLYHLNVLQQTAVKVQYESLEGSPKIESRKAETEYTLTVESHSGEIHTEHGKKIRLEIMEGQLKEDRRLGRERKVESLGTQSVEGVQAEGTRVTFTFPAGTEGNDQPFDIVSERWYSPELQMVVMTRHSDPRSGENLYRLTNINRSEPARSLFEPPSGFALKEERVEIRRKER